MGSIDQRDVGGWERRLPGLQVLRRYDAAWFPHDLMAGLVLKAVETPAPVSI